MANYQSQYTGEQIDAAVQQAQRVPTLEQNIASGDAETIMRMQGKDKDAQGNSIPHDNTFDPFYYKQFTGGLSAYADVSAWLDSLHATEVGSTIPLGLLRIYVNGSYLYVLENVISYNDQYTQTILNGNVSEIGIMPGTNMYVRERRLINGVMSWTPWRRFLTTDD